MGKPSISMGHFYKWAIHTMAMLNNQRVLPSNNGMELGPIST